MIVIIDYGMGNVGSIYNMLRKIGVPAAVSGERATIADAERIILPGVGAFDEGAKKLRDLGLIPLLEEKAIARKTPTLGICLGMQLMTKSSEEGTLPGLGWFDADTVRFHFGAENERLRIPNMGWHEITPKRPTPLLASLETDSRFYFVHSYHVRCADEGDVLATTRYGYDFASAIGKGNIFGTQFHPEKSHKFGLKLLQNFSQVPTS